MIRDYENRVHPVPDKKPHELLTFILEESGTKPVDLVPIFGSRRYVSDILSGRRKIPKDKTKLFAERFALRPDAFIERDGRASPSDRLPVGLKK